MAQLDAYRVFYVVGRTGSISKAAATLHVTQPAVSHAIKNLEEKLGVTLFLRVARGVKLTHEGNILFRYVEQAFNFLSLGEQRLAEHQQMQQGEIHIVASETLCKHVLLPNLSQFREKYPKILIHVTNRPTRETVSFIADGKADIGLVFFPVDESSLSTVDMVQIQDCFVAGVQASHLADVPLPISSMHEYPVIMLEKQSKTRDHLESFFLDEGALLHPAIELSSLDLIGEFAKAGFGIGAVIKEFVSEELEQKVLFEVPIIPPLPKRTIGFISLRDVPLSWAAKEFIHHCVEGQLYNASS